MHEKNMQLENIDSEAREWFTLMQSGSITELEQKQFQQWIISNDEHKNAYRRYEIIWRDLENLASTSEAKALRKSITPHLFERIGAIKTHFINIFVDKFSFKARAQFATLAIGFVVVAAAGTFLSSQKETITTSEYATNIGEIKKIVLEDGSEVTLGARSTIKSWSTKAERHVTLVDGQAFFKVSKNPSRPFFVNSSNTLVKVVGTQFDVRKSLDSIRVAVQEGIVKVSDIHESSKNNIEPVVLTASQQVIHLKNGKFENMNTISIAEIESWRNGRLVYQRATLADVIADANRYLGDVISIDSKSSGDVKNLGDLKVTAAVSIDKMDSLPEMLSKSLPITAYKDANNKIVISARNDLATP